MRISYHHCWHIHPYTILSVLVHLFVVLGSRVPLAFSQVLIFVFPFQAPRVRVEVKHVFCEDFSFFLLSLFSWLQFFLLLLGLEDMEL